MGRLLILNGSPRAPRSHSKQYAALFRSFWPEEVRAYTAIQKDMTDLFHQLADCSDLLLVFPLYADGLPVTLMKALEEIAPFLPADSLTVHVLVNCGFLEPEQNAVALDMVRLFCEQNGAAYGSTLCIGSGEAILTTPFVSLVKRKIQKLARAIAAKRRVDLKVTMPLPKSWYIRASTSYWIRYGAQNGVLPEQMRTMTIEGNS